MHCWFRTFNRNQYLITSEQKLSGTLGISIVSFRSKNSLATGTSRIIINFPGILRIVISRLIACNKKQVEIENQTVKQKELERSFDYLCYQPHRKNRPTSAQFLRDSHYQGWSVQSIWPEAHTLTDGTASAMELSFIDLPEPLLTSQTPLGGVSIAPWWQRHP